MSMTVKAYLEVGEGQTPEIRRFAVDQNVTSSYTYLANKIPQVFPSLATKSFDLYWKDADGDNIAFSSDDELTEALGFVNDGVFKVYIRPSTKQTTGPSCGPSDGPLHSGVICDGCEGRIRGSRFKCCVCPDYDLCCLCENKGLHEEHQMMRIRNPLMNGGPFGMYPPPPPPHHFGPGPFGPGGPFGGPFGGPGAHHNKPWRKMMKRCWRKWWKDMYHQQNGGDQATGTTCNDSDSDNEMGKEPKEARKEKEKMQCGDADDCCSGKPEKSANQEEEDSPTEEYLKDVGESVAAMLDPLGIDVAVDVECRGKRKKCHGWGGGRGRGGCGGRRGGWGRWFGQGGRPPFPWGGAPPMHPPQGPHAPSAPGAPPMGGPPHWMFNGGMPGFAMSGVFGGCSTGMSPQWTGQEEHSEKTAEKCCKEPNSASSAATEAEKKQEQQAECDFDVAMGSPQEAEKDNEDNEWTDLCTSTPPPPPPSNTAEPELVTAPSHPVPSVAAALDQLKAMGFNDDGGWLTQLLEAKNGDINKVLDALKPHRPSVQ